MSSNKKSKKRRVDELLFHRELCRSLTEAQALVYAGKVYTKDRKINKPSELLGEEDFLGLKGTSKSNFVSRGGDKLKSALEQLNLLDFFKGKIVLDIGSSTGGFVDCALQNGAKLVLALDVGENQLSWELRKSSQVVSIEKTHIKDFSPEGYPDAQVILADISFNSLASLAPWVVQASQDSSLELLLLVKPQFELPKGLVPKGGVVVNEEDRLSACKIVEEAFLKLGFTLVATVESTTKGRTGNQESFLHFKRRR